MASINTRAPYLQPRKHLAYPERSNNGDAAYAYTLALGDELAPQLADTVDIACMSFASVRAAYRQQFHASLGGIMARTRPRTSLGRRDKGASTVGSIYGGRPRHRSCTGNRASCEMLKRSIHFGLLERMREFLRCKFTHPVPRARVCDPKSQANSYISRSLSHRLLVLLELVDEGLLFEALCVRLQLHDKCLPVS